MKKFLMLSFIVLTVVFLTGCDLFNKEPKYPTVITKCTLTGNNGATSEEITSVNNIIVKKVKSSLYYCYKPVPSYFTYIEEALNDGWCKLINGSSLPEINKEYEEEGRIYYAKIEPSKDPAQIFIMETINFDKRDMDKTKSYNTTLDYISDGKAYLDKYISSLKSYKCEEVE